MTNAERIEQLKEEVHDILADNILHRDPRMSHVAIVSNPHFTVEDMEMVLSELGDAEYANENLQQWKQKAMQGDVESKAMAWSKVYQTCEKAGLHSSTGSVSLACKGVDRVCLFIEHLAQTRDEQAKRIKELEQQKYLEH